jgi:pyruvate dehydrogenase E1 component alpha subunit
MSVISAVLTDPSTAAELAPRQLLAPDGSLHADAETALSGEQQREAFRWMLLSQMVDEKAFNLQRQGRLGTYAPARGQEAIAVGVSMALRLESDWLVPQYRELAAQLRHGWSLRDAFLFFRGHPDGWRAPERVLPIAIALAAQLPHAAGLAWGLKQQGTDAVVATFCGDGGSSEGDFHEALNFAGVMRAPVIFVIQDNNWAISTPRAKQTAARTFAARADGYGMACARVDGNDLLAVHEAAAAAVARARAGDGPTLIDAKTYRLLAHNTVDDATRYVDAAELADAEAREPLMRLRIHLAAQGLLDESDEQAIRAELGASIEAAVAEAEAWPQAQRAAIYEHAYAVDPPRLARQRADAEAAS